MCVHVCVCVCRFQPAPRQVAVPKPPPGAPPLAPAMQFALEEAVRQAGALNGVYATLEEQGRVR